MNATKIEWVKNPDGTQGYTWNPITGCLKGCPYCYARKLANGRLRSRYLANRNVPPIDTKEPLTLEQAGELQTRLNDPFYPRFWPDRLADIPKDWKTLAGWQEVKSRGIFVCDMGELFGDWIPEIWQEIIFEEIRKADQHRFYLLTKQPQNLIKFSPFPDNCWVGVTATDTRMALDACLKLGDIEASVRYLSLEPMLNSINLPPEHLKVCKINQVIIGAQTKPYKPPKIEWVEEIVRAADRAGVKVFLKDNLKPLLETLDITGTSFGRLTSLNVKAIKDTQGLLRQHGWYDLRQEMPTTNV